MSRRPAAALAVVMLVVATLLLGGAWAPSSLAQAAPDRSEVVLVLDFSASILEDVTNRDRFATALDQIADRVDATTADLTAGDATMTIIQFAAKAADYTGCADLKLLASPPAVARFSSCLRQVASAYRKGVDPALSARIGIDTNYVAAMEAAARHLTTQAVRPALILFTDGKHDVAGVPVSQVQPARDRLFGSLSPFALLPVGMGLNPSERPALEAGLANLRIIRDMPTCLGGSQVEWPQVVFGSPAAAGNAVALALQDVTCTFTVAPSPSAEASPTPAAPKPGDVTSISLSAGDGRIDMSWAAPATPPAPIIDYRVRCRTGGGNWIESNEGTSIETSATVSGLTNGLPYECEVAVVDAAGVGDWTSAGSTATPLGRPATPPKPDVAPLDRGVRIDVAAQDPAAVTSYRFECSDDQGRTWPARIDVPSAAGPQAEIGNLTNGTEYVCRAFAANATGMSDPSIASDAVRPCGSFFDCNPIVTPILGTLGLVAAAAVLLILLVLYRGRTRGYVVAVVDVVHTANLGHGSNLGIAFVRSRPGGPVTGIVADRTRNANIRIRLRGGDRFEVRDAVTRHSAVSGQPIVTTDDQGVRHEIVLRSFRTASAAEPASSRR